MIPDTIDVQDIKEAQISLRSLVQTSPVYPSAYLSRKFGASIYLKLENSQATRSFKVRGAGNVIMHFSESQRSQGAITYSTGNHGKAASYIGTQLGIPVRVCISELAPKNKIEGILEFGGIPVVYGKSQDEAMQQAFHLAEQNGYSIIDPINNPYTVSGHGTIGLELLEQIENLSMVLVPVSGGALIAGIATVIKTLKPEVQVIGVSMERGAAMHASLAAGAPILVPEVSSIADSLQGGISLNNAYSFSIVKKLVDDIVLVTEEDIINAIYSAFHHDHQVLEGAGAVGIAAIISGKVKVAPNQSAVCVCTGSNIDTTRFLEIVNGRSEVSN